MIIIFCSFYFLFYGNYRYDTFANDYIFEPDQIEFIDGYNVLVDDAEKRRVESIIEEIQEEGFLTSNNNKSKKRNVLRRKRKIKNCSDPIHLQQIMP